MRRSFQWTIILGVLLALTLGVAACGGDDSGGGESGTSKGTPAEGKQGGKLTSLWAGDVDFIDPGITYYQVGNIVVRATQSSLYLPKVDDASAVEPILADSDPQISADGCTVTVKIIAASSSHRRSTERSPRRTSSTRSSAASSTP